MRVGVRALVMLREGRKALGREEEGGEEGVGKEEGAWEGGEGRGRRN